VGRNPEGNQRIRDQRRRLVLSAALKLFADRGLAATRISDIAWAAGISDGLVYHYFDSKDAIFVELVRSALAAMVASAHALENLAVSPRDRLKLALGGVRRDLARRGDAANALVLVASAAVSANVPADALQALEDGQLELQASIARIVEAGQADGSVRPGEPAELASVFWTLILGLAVRRGIRSDNAPAPSAELLVSLFGVDPPALTRGDRTLDAGTRSY